MTAQPLTSKYKLRTYFMYRMSVFKGNLVSVSIFSLLSYPLIALAMMMYLDVRHQRDSFQTTTDISYTEFDLRMSTLEFIDSILVGIGIAAAVYLFIYGFFIVKKIFRRLYDKNCVDMEFGLPLDHNTRFFGDVLTGMIVYIVPQTIAVILAHIMMIPVYSGADSTFLSKYTGQIQFIEYDSILMLLGCIMQFFFVLMILGFCGRKLTANTVPFILGVGIPAAVFFLRMIVFACAYGMDYGDIYDIPSASYILQCSPVGMCITMFFMTADGIQELVSGPSEIFGLLFSALYCAAAYFLIKYRRAERTGKAFVYKGGRYAVQFLILLATGSVIFLPIYDRLTINDSYYAVSYYLYRLLQVPPQTLLSAWLIINIIVFFVIEIICKEKLKKPKNLAFSVARFAASAGLSALVCFVFARCDGFGAADYVPDVNDVRSITMMSYTPSSYIMIDGSPVTLDDPEAIEKIGAFHKLILEKRPDVRGDEDFSYFTSQVRVNLNYILKDGSSVTRHYYLPKDYAKDSFTVFFESGAFAKQYDLASVVGENASVRYRTIVENSSGNGSYHYDYVTADIPFDRLSDALQKDASRMTFYDMFFSEGLESEWLTVQGTDNRTCNFLVTSNFENTVALFKEYGIDLYAGKYDHVEKYYMVKYKSVGGYTTDIEPDIAPDGSYYYDREYRELTYEQAREALAHSSVISAYSENRDIYRIVPIYKNISDGNVVYYNGDIGELYIAESWCDEAAKIYESCQTVSDSDLEKYLPYR